MSFFPTALAALALALAACTALPHPQTLPELPQQAQWFKLEQTDAAGQTVQTSLLAVERLPDGIRFAADCRRPRRNALSRCEAGAA